MKKYICKKFHKANKALEENEKVPRKLKKVILGKKT